MGRQLDNRTCVCGSQRTYFNLQVLLPATELQGKAEEQLESSAQRAMPRKLNKFCAPRRPAAHKQGRARASLRRWPVGKWDPSPNLSSPLAHGVYRRRVELSTRTPGRGEAGRCRAPPLRLLTYPERPSRPRRSLAEPAPAARTAAARPARTPPLFPGALSARSNRSAPRAALGARDRSASPSAPYRSPAAAAAGPPVTK